MNTGVYLFRAYSARDSCSIVPGAMPQAFTFRAFSASKNAS